MGKGLVVPPVLEVNYFTNMAEKMKTASVSSVSVYMPSFNSKQCFLPMNVYMNHFLGTLKN